VIAWLKPRRLLVRELAQMVAEARELREAAVRRAKDNESLRAALRRERRAVADLAGLGVLEHVGYVHFVSDYQPAFLPVLCPKCRPVYLGLPTKEQSS
jgi:hypothetical protein